MRSFHARSETYRTARASVSDAHTRHPHSQLWGDGTTASSDGPFFQASDRAAGRRDINLHYGSEPGSKFYSALSDQYGYFSILPISPTESEAVDVLDDLFDHDTILEIEELFTDTGGASDHVFALFALIGKRFAPRLFNSRIGNSTPSRRPMPIRHWRATSVHRSILLSFWSTGTIYCAWLRQSRRARSLPRRSSKGCPPHRNRAT